MTARYSNGLMLWFCGPKQELMRNHMRLFLNRADPEAIDAANRADRAHDGGLCEACLARRTKAFAQALDGHARLQIQDFL